MQLDRNEISNILHYENQAMDKGYTDYILCRLLVLKALSFLPSSWVCGVVRLTVEQRCYLYAISRLYFYSSRRGNNKHLRHRSKKRVVLVLLRGMHKKRSSVKLKPKTRLILTISFIRFYHTNDGKFDKERYCN